MTRTTLRTDPPREYPLIEAFRGRVWRSRWTLYTRELSLVCAIAALIAFLRDHALIFELSLALLIILTILSGLGLLITQIRRAYLVRSGPRVNGTLIARRRRMFLHELLRGAAHRTFEVHYRFQSKEGEDIDGRLLLCRCAYEHLKEGSLDIIYDPNNPKRNLPLRVAIMRIPH